ncbi:RNA chaperone Hfq [Senegalia massiliensis]|jgi:host factor-I protein|uniref:RNA-binding protein Hfq n=2 Tax=Senegalia massiliensis TaxID=1720316 RepID=A0A845R3C1_9CLOT|nr:RNA chaperone Hfq [Senegalia massiliensis]NBI07932.1 RNA chaperone Hfq [Senegalia massiliensis]
MKSNINLQDIFLNKLRRAEIPVTIYLMNGFQLKGLVRGFDNYTISLENEGNQNMIYKHAISTMIPAKNIDLTEK